MVAVLAMVGTAYALVLNNPDHDHDTVAIDPSTPPPTSGARTPPPDRNDTGETVPVEDALAACAATLTAAADVIAEADTGVTHWSGHIGARADWLAGRISQDEKAATYKRTRLAGPDDQQRFSAALATFQESPGCDQLRGVSVDAAVTRAEDLGACRDRFDRASAAISAGSDAMADWQAHLDDMAQHAEGHMANDEADQVWAEAAANAPINIDAFAAAKNEWGSAPPCPGGDG